MVNWGEGVLYSPRARTSAEPCWPVPPNTTMFLVIVISVGQHRGEFRYLYVETGPICLPPMSWLVALGTDMVSSPVKQHAV